MYSMHATAETTILDAQTAIPMPIYSFSCKIPHIIIQLSPKSPPSFDINCGIVIVGTPALRI